MLPFTSLERIRRRMSHRGRILDLLPARDALQEAYRQRRYNIFLSSSRFYPSVGGKAVRHAVQPKIALYIDVQPG